MLVNKIKPKTRSRVRTVFAVIAVIISAFIIAISMNIKQATQKTILNYEENSDVLYQVYTGDNRYDIAANQEYDSSRIDTIKTNFNYNFLADAKFDCNYNYEITGHIIVLDGTTEIWQHDIDLLTATKHLNQHSNGFKIIEFMDINYDEYEKIVNNNLPNYKASYETNLVLTLNVIVDGEYARYHEEIKGNADLSITIPLFKNKVAFTVTHDNINDESIKGIEDSAVKNIFLFLIGLIVFISSSVVIVNEFLGAVKEDKKLLKYRAEIKRIKKTIGETAHLKKLPSFDDKMIKLVDEIDLIIALQKQVDLPVMIVEKIKNQETWFMIYNEKIAYVFVVNK